MWCFPSPEASFVDWHGICHTASCSGHWAQSQMTTLERPTTQDKRRSCPGPPHVWKGFCHCFRKREEVQPSCHTHAFKKQPLKEQPRMQNLLCVLSSKAQDLGSGKHPMGIAVSRGALGEHRKRSPKGVPVRAAGQGEGRAFTDQGSRAKAEIVSQVSGSGSGLGSCGAGPGGNGRGLSEPGPLSTHPPSLGQAARGCHSAKC